MSEDSIPYKTAEPVDREGPEPGFPQQYSNVFIEDKPPIYDSRITNDACPINAAGLAHKLAGQPSNTVIAVQTGSAEMDLILLIKACLESVPVDANTFERVATYVAQCLYAREKPPFISQQSVDPSAVQSAIKALAPRFKASQRDEQLRCDRLRSEMLRGVAGGTASSGESEDGSKAGVK